MKYLLIGLLALMMSCSSKQDPLALPETLEEAVSSNYRSLENKQRDKYRHPEETLNFFGLTPEMTVVEVAPGKGWYMEILAPLLTKEGRYIMATPIADKPYAKANDELINAWRLQFPKAKIETVIFSPPKTVTFPKNGIADMVVTFRNVHNWIAAQGEIEAFSAFYKVLKPGGILGIVEHRAFPSQEDLLEKNGYVREQDVIELAAKAGFKLVATSEINANPNDTKDYPEGVWTLPPTLKLGDKNREKYLAIGESDRMTLKFMKPMDE